MLIRPGDRGNGVVLVQHAPNAVTAFTPKLKPDGIFGRMTEQRVKQHLDWAVFKGRIAEISASPSIQRADDGQMQVTVEASITGGSGLTLKKKLGQLGLIKGLLYLATSITSDASIQASAGGKAAVEINLSPSGGTKVTLTGKAGPKAIFGPVTGPDGREHHQFTGLPFAASLTLSFEGEFDFP